MKEEKQMPPSEVLWHQYDAFNYPEAEDIARKHCKQGNSKWPSFTVEEWERGLRQARRHGKEQMDLNLATRLLTEAQSIIRPTRNQGDEAENTPHSERADVIRYAHGLLPAIDEANQELNLSDRNELMRYVCDATGIPNLQSLRSYMTIMR